MASSQDEFRCSREHRKLQFHIFLYVFPNSHKTYAGWVTSYLEVKWFCRNFMIWPDIRNEKIFVWIDLMNGGVTRFQFCPVHSDFQLITGTHNIPDFIGICVSSWTESLPLRGLFLIDSILSANAPNYWSNWALDVFSEFRRKEILCWIK